MIELRDYQRKALNDLYTWFGEHQGNPCIEAPTGSGKSYLIAAFCKENLEANPDIRIVMATHTKELIVQDANALLTIWPEAPVGIFSAGLKAKEYSKPITIGGIQSMYLHASDFGKVDVFLVDEAHMIPTEGEGREGMYLTFINWLKAINPELTVIGFTATPYRLKTGMITDKPGIFSAPLIKTIGIRELQARGTLAQLRSKATKEELLKLTEHVRIQGGDFVEKDLQSAIDTDLTSRAVVEETLKRAVGRRHIMFFCCGIDHAEHIRDILRENGETAEAVSTRCSAEERDDIIRRFKFGDVRFLTNTAILTTGFDYPEIDCIVMMRPTMSPGLYMQEVGRGLRPKKESKDCLVLDFAGNIRMHGPVAEVRPPEARKNKRKGVAPSKICPQCDEIVAIQSHICPCCGYEWPKSDKSDEYHLYDDDINGKLLPSMKVGLWRWAVCKSRAGEDMVRATYQRSLVDRKEVNEYFLLWRTDIVGIKAQRLFFDIVKRAGLELLDYDTINDLIDALNKAKKPVAITYKINGKYYNVVDRIWEDGNV